MATVSTPMTTEEFLALPDDGVERMLIRGELRVLGDGEVTRRNRWHSRYESNVVWVLRLWLSLNRSFKGVVFSGEAGCRLRHSPDTTVGIDVCLVDREIADRNPPGTTLIDGCPILAVELLSPSDKHEDISDKIDEYLNAGVKLVWILDPNMKTVTVYRSDVEPQMFNLKQTLTAEPHLPGFSAPVAEIFQ